MPARNFDYCALQFLNQWLEKEASYCKSLASNIEETQRQGIVAAANHFRVARNLPKVYDEEAGIDRYKPIVEVLNTLGSVKAKNVIERVGQAQRRISESYGRRSVLSLTTKLLWIKVKTPVRIYDSQARIALGTPVGNYSAYTTAWSERYAQHEEEIKEACYRLTRMLSYTVEPSLRCERLNKLVEQRWFQERVLDIYLWHEGNS